MAPFDSVADQSPAFRADLEGFKAKRRRERLSSLASAPPVRQRNDLLPPLVVEEVFLADLVSPARNVRRQEAAHIREVAVPRSPRFGFCDPVLIGRAARSSWMARSASRPPNNWVFLRISCIRDPASHPASSNAFYALPPTGWRKKASGTLEDFKIEFEEPIVEQTPIEISGFSVFPRSIKSCSATIHRPTNKGRLRLRPELSRSHGKATSFVLANIGSFAVMPPFTKSSRLSCGAMVQPGSS